MPGWIIITIIFSAMFLLLLLGMPMAFSMLISAFLGFLLLEQVSAIIMCCATSFHDLLASYTLSVAFLFILVGEIAACTGLAEKAYDSLQKIIGNLPGGLILVTILACGLFGACSGSTVASSAVFAKISGPPMKKLNYNEGFSLAAVATAGGLAAIIPPSIMIVFYGMLTGVSVGATLIAGVLPGIILTLFLSGYVYFKVLLSPSLAPKGLFIKSTTKDKIYATIEMWPILLIFVTIIGGIYLGIFTPTESGAIGSLIILIYAFSVKTKFKSIVIAFRNTVATSAQIFIIIVSGMILAKVVVMSGVTQEAIEFIQKANLNIYGLWIITILVFIILGMVLDPVSMLVLTLPFFFPILTQFGVDKLAFGIITMVLVQIAVITPPIGFNVYVVASAAGIDPSKVFFRIGPFFILLLAFIFLLITCPAICYWLPNFIFR